MNFKDHAATIMRTGTTVRETVDVTSTQDFPSLGDSNLVLTSKQDFPTVGATHAFQEPSQGGRQRGKKKPNQRNVQTAAAGNRNVGQGANMFAKQKSQEEEKVEIDDYPSLGEQYAIPEPSQQSQRGKKKQNQRDVQAAAASSKPDDWGVGML